MINRMSYWMILSLAVAGLLLPLAAAWAEDISEPGDSQPQPAAPQTPASPDAPADAEGDAPETPATPTQTTQPTTQPTGRRGQDSGFARLLPLLLGAMILMWIFAGRRTRKADKQRKEMLGNLKKGDKVTSIGGIVGTTLDVREHEVTVKVDETSNTRLKFARWAIRSVGTPAEEGEKEGESK